MISCPVMLAVKTEASFLGRIRIPRFLFRLVPFAKNAKEPRHILDHLTRVFPGERPIRAGLENLDRPIQKRLINGAMRRRNGNSFRMAVCSRTPITPPIRHLVQPPNTRKKLPPDKNENATGHEKRLYPLYTTMRARGRNCINSACLGNSGCRAGFRIFRSPAGRQGIRVRSVRISSPRFPQRHASSTPHQGASLKCKVQIFGEPVRFKVALLQACL